MKFALLGTDADTLELAQAIVDSEHDLVAAYEVPPEFRPLLRQIAPRAITDTSWDGLLAGDAAEVVIVARGANDEERASQLRTLVQTGVPLVIAHPVHESMLIYYELDMIRQESGCNMLPYAPERWHPVVPRLSEILSQGVNSPIGAIQHVAFERAMEQRTIPRVLAAFARDAELLRALCGEMTRIGATAAPSAEVDYASLGIQMSGPTNMLVRWSVSPVDDAAGGTLTLVGDRGKVMVTIPADRTAWSWEQRVAGASQVEELPDWDPATTAIEKMVALCAGEPIAPTWVDASRDLELTDAIERSVKRGRNIDLHYEEHTEEGTFKGMMAASGCLLLIGALVLTIIATTAVNLNVPLAGTWPYLLLGALSIFLALQFLKLVYPSKPLQ